MVRMKVPYSRRSSLLYDQNTGK
jgi:hypothetical protein